MIIHSLYDTFKVNTAALPDAAEMFVYIYLGITVTEVLSCFTFAPAISFVNSKYLVAATTTKLTASITTTPSAYNKHVLVDEILSKSA